MTFVTDGKGIKINIENSELWYHGSNEKLTMLRRGSSITKNKELARAFSHKPNKVWVDDEGKIKHSGTENGYLYIIDEPIRQGDLRVHEACAEGDEWEMITNRELMLKEITNGGIKGILLDSGRVLNGPATGHWFITPNFYKYVDSKKIEDIPYSKIEDAFSKAGEYITEEKLIVTEEEEYEKFLEYYNIFFSFLPQLGMTKENIESIARDLVYNYDKYTFFEDAIEVMPKLKGKYKLAVVSDAWPSLENVFIKAGHRKYFDSFVISSVNGISKPEEKMYKLALEELGIAPEEAVFVDDSIKNCEGAEQLGIRSFLMVRDTCEYERLRKETKVNCKSYTVINDLRELLLLID